MGDIDAAAALQEQLRQARHEEEKFKRREAELEAALVTDLAPHESLLTLAFRLVQVS
eukprot:m.421371 g.421371  ORF g.421371 m.421371 type:complete len:57 (+) comp16846_c4_seq3:65-235(+)